MKIAIRNLILFLFALLTLNSCFFRKHPDKKWDTKRHKKFRYYKGNNYGGRRLWVRPAHYGRSLYSR